MLARSGIFGVITSLVLLVAPASASTNAGGVDMQQACLEQYGSGWTAGYYAGSAYNWFCVNSAGTKESINVDEYCAVTYGKNAYADPQGGQVFDWGCYWP